MKQSRIQAVDHVELEALAGMQESIRWFYGEVAGLAELPSMGGQTDAIRFKSERIELRIRFVSEPEVDGNAVRVTIGVRVLAETAELLAERKVPSERSSGIHYTDRVLLALDPAGHRVAFRRVWDIGVL